MITLAVTFQSKYRGDPDLLHSLYPDIRNYHYVLVSGETYQEAREKIFLLFGRDWSSDYLYSTDGILDEDFQRQIQEYALVELIPLPPKKEDEDFADIWYV